MRPLIFLSCLLVVLVLGLYYLRRRKRREAFQVNTPEAISKLHQLSEAVRDVLSYDEREDELTSLLAGRDVYSEFTMSEGSRSYTENKRRVVLCLRKSPDEFYSWNSLMFVVLHEVAHVICDELHHTAKFHSINRALMRRAERLGYYNPKIPFESSYCGM